METISVIGSTASTGGKIVINKKDIDAQSVTSIRDSVLASTPRLKKGKATAGEASVEKAVYSYIQAVRALGRETVNTVEIARALGVNIDAVESAVAKLRAKGVRPLAR